MTIPLLVDMNLSTEWVPFLEQAGWPARHWSDIGDGRAADSLIMSWAVLNGYAVFTHDLDFGTALALTHANGPSVIQVRGNRVLPEQIGSVVLATLAQYEIELAAGALVVVEERRRRVRVLPL